MHRFVLAAALLALGCDSGGDAPPTDSCASPSSGSIDSVEIGAAGIGDLAGMPSPFVPLAEGDGVPLIRGSQGAYMIGLVLRVSGASAPSCLGQRTVVTDVAGTRITAAAPPLSTYAQPDGTRLTHPLWLPAEYPANFIVTVDAAGQSLTRHLHLLLLK